MEVKIQKSLARSVQYLAEASEVTPGGAPCGKWWSPNLIYAARAKGAYITDLDGNEYLDYHGASGSVFLGYSDPEVDEAVIEVIRHHGNQFALPHQFEIELAAKLCEHIPCAEMSAFSNAGTDTMQFALRVARSYTGKSKIVKFEGGYQGWADSVAVSISPARADAGSAHSPNAVPDTTGLPPEVLGTVLVCPYNDAESVAETFDAHRDAIAALVVEPYVHGTNLRPKPGFLAALRQLCDAAGVVLIFDEIVTGFRHGLGGLQAQEGVTPDVAIFGKAMGNGYPISAVVGKKEYMRTLSPTGGGMLSGTYNGNPLSATAALKTIEILERPGLYERVFGLGDQLRGGIQAAIDRLGVRACCVGYGSAWYLHFEREPPENWRDVLSYVEGGARAKEQAYRNHLLNRDIFLYPVNGTRAYLGAAHTEAEIQRTIDASVEFLTDHRAELQ